MIILIIIGVIATATLVNKLVKRKVKVLLLPPPPPKKKVRHLKIVK